MVKASTKSHGRFRLMSALKLKEEFLVIVSECFAQSDAR